MALTVRGAGYVYDAGTGFARRALEGVDVELQPGGLMLLLGATGSGKSTLLKLCGGLLQASEGTVEVDGAAASALAPGSATGLVFQDPEVQLFAETVLEDVMFGPANLGVRSEEALERARAALAATGLDPDLFGGRSPFTLSGGEARRAAIAGVLAMAPAYLLLDEPTAGLDARGREAVLAAVESARRHAGVLVVTHDPEELASLADAVLVLAEGRPVLSGPPAEALVDAGALDSAGVRAPETVRAQALAARRARVARPFALDARVAAGRLHAALAGDGDAARDGRGTQ